MIYFFGLAASASPLCDSKALWLVIACVTWPNQLFCSPSHLVVSRIRLIQVILAADIFFKPTYYWTVHFSARCISRTAVENIFTGVIIMCSIVLPVASQIVLCRISWILCSGFYVTPWHSHKARKCQHKTGRAILFIDYHCRTVPVLSHLFQMYMLDVCGIVYICEVPLHLLQVIV